ncbi:family 76 glycosyl hydrolase [Xylariaceae sp. FL0804]|nr:family 76 glycosyl hydrolase [Xylariaceae sp. FL0804]
MVRLSTPLQVVASGLLLGLVGRGLAALEVDLDDDASIREAAAQVAADLLTFYHGDEPGQVPGILPGPPPDGDYYWWQGGAMWGALLDYRSAAGSDDNDAMISSAMLWQAGPDRDYMPPNWTASLGNDDQAFWALSALLAAETGFADPPPDEPQWLALAQAVFNEQTHEDRRVPNGNCQGGLRWQIFPSNNGYDYINTVANACYFNIGARLARYTGNATYGELAAQTFDLIHRLGYISETWDVYDGAHLPDCTDINRAQFSYNAAMLLQGCAFMYDFTGDEIWATRLDRLTDRTLAYFFPNGTAFEPACEPGRACNTDMESFKGFLHRWLATAVQLAPHTRGVILPVLRTSAAAAVAQCTGGANGRMCGFHWASGAFDGATGAAQQMNVLGALTSLLMASEGADVPLTNATGGTAGGDPNAGTAATKDPQAYYRPVTAGDRVGAGLVTVVLAGGALAAFGWMAKD